MADLDYNVQLERSGNCGRFVIKLDDDHEAEMVFHEREGDFLVYHTGVPKAFEGKGIALELVKTGVQYAREHDKKIQPVCPYVAKQFERHKDWADVLAKPLKAGLKSAMDMVNAAAAEIETLSVAAAKAAVASGEALFVDLRDIRELDREGRIEGAVHAPRGLLEFWIDPLSLYHKTELATDKKLIFFCAAGWRSALATKTVKEMGHTHVAHMEGGFSAWRDAEGEIVKTQDKA